MAFDRGLPVASHGDRPGDDDGGARASADPDDRPQDQGPGVARGGARRRRPAGRPLLVIAEEVSPEVVASLLGGGAAGPLPRRPSAGIRPLAQGAARGHGDPDRWAGDRARSRRADRGRDGSRSRRRGAGEDRAPATPPSCAARAIRRRSRARRAQVQRQLRKRPAQHRAGQAARASCKTLRRRGGPLRRRRHAGRAEADRATDRGRASTPCAPRPRTASSRAAARRSPTSRRRSSP